jgi:uncharacterized protein (DUF58 family)
MRPSGRFLALLSVAFVPALLPVFVAAELWVVWIITLAASFALFLADLALCHAPRDIEVELSLPERLYIGDDETWTIFTLRSRSARAVEVELHLDHSRELIVDMDDEIRLRVGVEHPVSATMAAHRRGQWSIEALWMRWTGPLGLLVRTSRRELNAEIPVTPNTRAVRAAAIRFFSNPDFKSGLKVEHYLGDGSEFDSLREFQVGHDSRAIDWKASARHIKLMAREYRAERNHDVILAIDTGRLMGEPIAGVARLDHAINASLLMAWCILKTGDRVGLFAFDERVRSSLRPVGGISSLSHLQRHAAQLDYGQGETNFTLGLLQLQAETKRRSLVVVITEFADTITAELMIENVLRLNRRHLVVFVALRDTELVKMAEESPRNSLGLHRASVAGGLIRERQRVLAELARHGVRCLDASPTQLTTALLNEYLDIKRRELV